MDSTAYKYLIHRLQNKKSDSLAAIPATFVHSKVCLTESLIADCRRFLKMICAGEKTARIPRPAILDIQENAFSGLFLLAHHAVLEVMNGSGPAAHRFRVDGVELCRLLCFCIQGRKAPGILFHDVAAAPMYCFLLEAMLNTGWCDGSMIETTKRSAHAYFLAFRKSLHRLSSDMLGTALGYLWSAWTLAQMTDKIHPSGNKPREPGLAHFGWNDGTGAYSYIARNAFSPLPFFLLNMGPCEITHPFGRFELDNAVGLRLHVNGERIRPVASPLGTDISRPQVEGKKFVYSCSTPAIPSIVWTVVFLWTDATVYRIDIVRVLKNASPVTIKGTLVLENDTLLRLSGPDCYFGEDRQNTVVRFIENPLDFHFTEQKPSSLSTFDSSSIVTDSGKPLRLVCAWSSGRGITDVNHIRMLGIYDEDDAV
jgi:hypothetical protein